MEELKGLVVRTLETNGYLAAAAGVVRFCFLRFLGVGGLGNLFWVKQSCSCLVECLGYTKMAFIVFFNTREGASSDVIRHLMP